MISFDPFSPSNRTPSQTRNSMPYRLFRAIPFIFRAKHSTKVMMNVPRTLRKRSIVLETYRYGAKEQPTELNKKILLFLIVTISNDDIFPGKVVFAARFCILHGNKIFRSVCRIPSSELYNFHVFYAYRRLYFTNGSVSTLLFKLSTINVISRSRCVVF